MNKLIRQTLSHCIYLFVVILFSCSSDLAPELQPEVETSGVPDERQLALSAEDLPPALSILHHFPKGDQEKVEALWASGRIPEYLAEVNLETKQLVQPKKALKNSEDTIRFEDGFDPFYLGAQDLEQRSIDSDCGSLHDGEPSNFRLSFADASQSNAWCIMGVVKFALFNAVSHYSNFNNIMVDIARDLTNGLDFAPQGVKQYYYNNDIATLGADSLEIEFYYGLCGQHRDGSSDQEAYDLCLDQADNSTYHRVSVMILQPKSGYEAGDKIGKFEWVGNAEGESHGEIIISKALMTPGQYIGFAPEQMQFEFASDVDGYMKDVVIKHEARLPGGEPWREQEWEANIVRLTRLPETDEQKGAWVVQGSVKVFVSTEFNPAGPGDSGFHFGHVETKKRLYFVAVSEDGFDPEQNKAIYKVVLAKDDDEVNDLLDLDLYPAYEWDQEFHLFATYRKLLEETWTEAHYLEAHDLKPRPIIVKDAVAGGENIKLWGQNMRQVMSALNFSADDSRVFSGQDYFKVIQRFNASYLEYAGTVCDIGGTLIKTIPHPQDDHLMFYGTDTGIHLVDIGSMEAPDCTIVSTIVWHYPALGGFHGYQNLDFTVSPDGRYVYELPSLYMDSSASTDSQKLFVVVWDVEAPLAPLMTHRLDHNYRNYQVKSLAYDGRVAIYNTFYDTARVDVLDPTASKKLSITHPKAIDGTAINLDYPAQITVLSDETLYRWDLAAWDDLQDESWEITTSGVLLQSYVPGFSYDNSEIPLALDYDEATSRLLVFAERQVAFIDVANEGAYHPEVHHSWVAPGEHDIKFTAISKTGQLLISHQALSADHSYVFNWPLADALPAFTESKHQFVGSHPSPRQAVTTQDSQFLLTIGGNQAVLWDLFLTEQLMELDGHSGELVDAFFTEDEQSIITGSEDGTVKIWDMDDQSQSYGQAIVMIPQIPSQAGVLAVDMDENYSPSRIAVAYSDGEIAIYNDAGARLKTILPGQGEIYDMEFSADGGYLAVALSAAQILFVNADPTMAEPYTQQWLTQAGPDGARISNVSFYPDNPHYLAFTSSYNSFIGTYYSGIYDLTALSSGGAPVYKQVLYSDTLEGEPNMLAPSFVSVGLVDGTPYILGTVSVSESHAARIYIADPNAINIGEQQGGQNEHGADLIGGYADSEAEQVQDERLMISAHHSASGEYVFITQEAPYYDPDWVDFEKYFDPDLDGVRSIPDRRDTLNPYYVLPIDTTDGCFYWSTEDVSCTVTCEEAGGCQGYDVQSMWTTKTVPSNFSELYDKLDAVESDYPLTNGYFTESFISKTID